nr:DUF4340 domain-containing protein [Gammaproteobacteria bacterium]
MQRWIPVLAIVLGLQLALAVVLGVSGDRLTAQQPDTPLVQAELKTADRLLIEGPHPGDPPSDQAAEKTAPVALSKQDGGWILPSYADAPADAARVQGVLDKLADTKRGYAVATTAGALKRFKVADDAFERRVVVSHGDEILATIYLGSSPGLRKTHARTAADEAVYAVELTAYELPSQADEWLDKGLLKADTEALGAIEMTWRGQSGLRLIRHDEGADDPQKDGWRAEGLPEGEQLNAEQARVLARAITELRVDGVLGTEAKPEWRQDEPLLTLGLEKRDGERVLWTLSKPEKGDRHVLKASNRPWYLELEEWNAKPLLEAAARDKLAVADKPTGEEEHEGGAPVNEPETDSVGNAPEMQTPDVPGTAETPQSAD